MAVVVMLIILLAMLLVFLFNCKTYWELRTEYGIRGSDGGDSGDGGGNSDGDEGDDDDADGDGGDVDKSGAVLGITNRNRGSMGTQQIMMGK